MLNNEKVPRLGYLNILEVMGKQTKINEYIVLIEHPTWVPTVMKNTTPGVLEECKNKTMSRYARSQKISNVRNRELVKIRVHVRWVA